MSATSTAFVVLVGAAALVSALGVVVFENPLRSAVCLLTHIVSLAGLYLTLSAHMLAALQLMVYAGAVVVLFVFTIMLIGPTPASELRPKALWTRAFGGGLIGMTVMMLSGVVATIKAPRPLLKLCEPWQGAECDQFGGIRVMAMALYRNGWVPFELVSILLVVAVVGAIAVARSRNNQTEIAVLPQTAEARQNANPALLEKPEAV